MILDAKTCSQVVDKLRRSELNYETIIEEHQRNSTAWTDTSFNFPESISPTTIPQESEFSIALDVNKI